MEQRPPNPTPRSGSAPAPPGGAGGPDSRGHEARQEVARAATEARDAASQLARQAAETGKHKLTEMTERQKEGARHRLGSVAHAMRAAGESLRGENENRLGEMIEEAAGGIERAAGYLERQDFEGLARDAGGLARRHPQAFLGGLFVVGAMVGRFLRASSPDERDEDRPRGVVRRVGDYEAEHRSAVESAIHAPSSAAPPAWRPEGGPL